MLPEAGIWATVRPERTVLVVVRNLTSLVRLLDILPLFDSDHRLAVRFTLDHGSAFTAGLPRQLDRFGITLLDWAEATSHEFDLILAAHVNPSLAALQGPLVVVPHGVGYNRRLPIRTNEKDAPVGLSPYELTVDNKVFPTVIGLSHENQRSVLWEHAPEAAPLATVIGDPTWDRIRANEARRDLYRRDLGVLPGQRLILVSSTWGANSLLGKTPDLVDRLLAELPMDAYRVVLVLHPNIWAGHGVHTVRAWLRNALDNGLLLIMPEDSWQAAVIAADLNIGDHGSVAFYATALGRPYLYSADGLQDLTPSSVTAALICAATGLNTEEPLRPQIERATPSATLTDITAAALGQPGQSWAALRDTCYRLLKLAAPDQPPRMPPISSPSPLRGHPTTAFHLVATDHGSTVDVERFPAARYWCHGARVHRDHLLAVHEEESDRRLLEFAQLVFRTNPLPADEVSAWATKALGLPCTFATMVRTVAGACVLTFRDPALNLTLRTDAIAPEHLVLIAAAAFHRQVRGPRLIPWTRLRVRIAGGPEITVQVRATKLPRSVRRPLRRQLAQAGQ